MEMLATGTTCSLNHSVTVTTPDTVKAIVEPQAELGIRQIFAKELRCRNPRFAHHPLSLDKSLAALKEEVERWNGRSDGLIRMGMVIEANAHWTASGMSTEELIVRGYELGKAAWHPHQQPHRRRDVLAGERLPQALARDRPHGCPLSDAARRARRNRIIAHCIHCTELDLEQMAHVGASLIYTPTSKSIRGGGIGPAANAASLGITTALGTDGPMVDYSDDMLEQIKMCMLFQHQRHLDPTRISVEQAVEMATIDGAKAAGLDDEIGSLDPGKRADIAIFDMRRPHVGTLQRPLSTFVCAGKGSDAKYVLVNGEVVYQEGSFTRGPGWKEVLRDAERIGREVIERSGLSGRLSPAWRKVERAARHHAAR